MIFRRFFRHLKEGLVGIKRHFAMAVSSMSTITITLLLLSVFSVFALNLFHTTKEIEESISLIAMIDYDITNQQRINSIGNEIKKIERVTQIEYRSKDQEFDLYSEKYPDIQEFSDQYKEDNPFHDIYIVYVDDGLYLKDVKAKVEKVSGITEVMDGGSETYTLVTFLQGARYVGVIIIGALLILAIYLIYNTIKVTIATRKDEIWIMRNVGAKNGYIRAPFLVEGIIIGLFGAVLPIAGTVYAYIKMYETTNGSLAGVINLIPIDPFLYYLSATLALIGLLIGFVGSYLSVCKYLRNIR